MVKKEEEANDKRHRRERMDVGQREWKNEEKERKGNEEEDRIMTGRREICDSLW